jgi:hypothetical protein
MLAPLPDALEIGLDFALKLESITPGTALEGVLNYITTQLEWKRYMLALHNT